MSEFKVKYEVGKDKGVKIAKVFATNLIHAEKLIKEKEGDQIQVLTISRA